MTFRKKETVKYLFWTFLLAWGIQIAVAVLYRNGLAVVGQLVTAAMMFVPLLGVLLAGQSLSGMGWKPRLKGNVKTLLAAWFLPALLTAVGAVLYFVVFPGHLDLSGAYLASVAGTDEVLTQLEVQGLTYPLYILISVIGCLTYAPLVNMLLAVGEEAGWRGFLYPQLKAKFGKVKGLLIGGIIWGMWHWPLMWLIGYEYGTDYVGFPVVGMLLFCLFTIAAGILCDWLYEKSNCIWLPSVFHGAVNAAGTVPLAICAANTGSAILLGPAPIGLLAGLPLCICAAVLLFRAPVSQAETSLPPVESLDRAACPDVSCTRKGAEGMHWKKLIAPIIITVLVCIWFLFYIAVVLWIPGAPAIVRILGAVIPALLGGVAIYNLIQRIQEIRSGEEDDLDNY